MAQPTPKPVVVGTAAELANYVPSRGELTHESDTGVFKAGDGATVHSSLAQAGGTSVASARPMTIYLESVTPATEGIHWDNIYDARGSALTEIPAGMGLAFGTTVGASDPGTPGPTLVVTDDAWCGRVELMANANDDDTAWVDCVLSLNGDFTGGPRQDTPADPNKTGNNHELCPNAWYDAVQGNLISVMTFVYGTATTPDYVPIAYAVLKIVRHDVPTA